MSFCSKRLPVTVVTGFLGSGKTTILRHLLKHSGKRLAVLVNEFGSVGIDGDLFKSCGFCPEEEIEDRIVELKNGCLCCTVQDDFLPTMENLLSRSDQLDGILIETSGLALPRPLLQALSWPAVRSQVYVNGVVTVVDGEALKDGSPIGDVSTIEHQRQQDKSLDHLTPVDELFSDQLEVADLVLITRADRLTSPFLKQIERQLVPKIRPATPVWPISNGEINPSLILGLDHSSNLDNSHHQDHHHHHLDVFTSSIQLEIDVTQNKLERLLPDLANRYKIIRLKGRCWLSGKSIPLQVQMVGPRLSIWFEKVPSTVWKPKKYGLDLVFLSLNEFPEEGIAQAFEINS